MNVQFKSIQRISYQIGNETMSHFPGVGFAIMRFDYGILLQVERFSEALDLRVMVIFTMIKLLIKQNTVFYKCDYI